MDLQGVWINLKNPHLIYANHDFESQETDEKFEELVDDLEASGGSSRGDELYRSGQDMFRQCLEWLGIGASMEFDRFDSPPTDKQLTHAFRKWSSDPRVAFLRLHGVEHAGVGLAPGQIVFHLSRSRGIAFKPGVPRDSLDILCWHIVYLYVGGHLKVRRCAYAKCRKFFEPLNTRRIYCRDICRVKDHRKTPEQMREYMREYRRIKRRIRSKPKGRRRRKSWI